MHTQPPKHHSATACAVLAGSIIALTGCATARSPLTNSEAIGVTRDMVQVLTAEWPPLDTTVSLGADRRSIHEPLETELRRAGYAIQSPTRNGQSYPLSYTVERIGKLNVYHARLDMGSWWRVERLYRHNDAGELVADSAFSIVETEPWDRLAGSTPAIPLPDATAAADLEPPPPEGNAQDDAAPCDTLTVNPGSLRLNVARALSACGYRLGEWPFGDAVHAEDWLIPARYSVPVEGLDRVLAWLRQNYGLTGQLSDHDGKVDFKPVETQH